MVGDASALVPYYYNNGEMVPDSIWDQVVEEVYRSDMDEISAIAYAKGRLEELRKERAKQVSAA